MSKLNSSVRYLVMNRTNEVIAPRDENLPGFAPAALKASGMLAKQFSPSFKSDEGATGAKAFARALAAQYKGERFYVAKVIGGAVDAPTWVDAGNAVGDTVTAADIDTDTDENE